MRRFAAVAVRIATCCAGLTRDIELLVRLLTAKDWTAKRATARGALARSADRRFWWAQVAQLVEHATENRSVGGSTPSLGTII